MKKASAMFRPSFVPIIWCVVMLNFAGTVTPAVIYDAASVFSETSKIVLGLADIIKNTDYDAIAKDGNVQTSPVVVDVAIVCSKQFSENFENNREKILDFFSAYFWDIKMQFEQLPRSKMSFSVTSLTLISSIEEQPFIENLRDPKFGNASLARILPQFAHWISNKIAELPGYDMAILVTEAGLDKAATGVAQLGGMCSTSIDDAGRRITDAVMVLDGTLTGGQLQIARLSDSSKCLKNKSSRVPLIGPDFDSVLPPSIEEQCRLLSGDINAVAIPNTEGKECGLTECMGDHSSILISPLANSECRNGWRCHQRECIPLGSLLSNVGTGKCLVPKKTSLNSMTEIAMSNCRRSSSPFERFHIASLSGTTNKLLVVPCNTLSVSNLDGNSTEYKCMDRCLSAAQPFEEVVKLEKCDVTNDLQKWSLVDERRDENNFLLYNVGSNSCLKPRMYRNPVEQSEAIFPGLAETVFVHAECNTTDPIFRWKSSPVLRFPGKCPNNDDCITSVKPLFSIKISCSPNLVSLNMTSETVSFTPAALTSFNWNLTLTTKPEYCFLFQSALKWNAGRLTNVFEIDQEKLRLGWPNMTFAITPKGIDDFNITFAGTWETTWDTFEYFRFFLDIIKVIIANIYKEVLLYSAIIITVFYILGILIYVQRSVLWACMCAALRRIREILPFYFH